MTREAGAWEHAVGRLSSERGISLMECLVASVIATISILGLAHSFGVGRGMVNRYEISRMALGAAQSRLERLSVAAHGDTALTIGAHGPYGFVVDGQTLGTETWDVIWVDDPADGLGGADTDSNVHDLRRATVTIQWNEGATPKNVTLTRLCAAW